MVKKEKSQETRAPKTSAELSTFIKDRREGQRMGWSEIADELASLGYKSPKTQKPLAAASVRFSYYSPQEEAKMPAELAYYQASVNTLEMVRQAVKMKGTLEQRFNFIEQILQRLD